MAQSTPRKEIPFFNKVLLVLLRSPLHGLMSKGIMVITFTGRKSGTRYSTPVSYLLEGNNVTAFTRSPWWRNLQGGAPVEMTIRGKSYRGDAQVTVKDPAAVAAALGPFLAKKPDNGRFYQVTFDANGTPDPAAVAKAAEKIALIRISLS